jgi:1-acyl-sn-glycerol-3-phosphate acyltransferase
MAIKAGVPIVPIACSGAQKIMEKRSMVIRPGEILVEFLEPIDSSKYSLEERETLNERIRAALAAGLPPEQRPLETAKTVPDSSSTDEQNGEAHGI